MNRIETMIFGSIFLFFLGVGFTYLFYADDLAIPFFIAAIFISPGFHYLVRNLLRIRIPRFLKVIVISFMLSLAGFSTDNSSPDNTSSKSADYDSLFEILLDEEVEGSSIKVVYTRSTERSLIKKYAEKISKESDTRLILFMDSTDDIDFSDFTPSEIMQNSSVVAEYVKHPNARRGKIIFLDDYPNLRKSTIQNED